MDEINTFFKEHKTIDYEKFKKIILENKNILNSRRNSTLNLKVELLNDIKKSPARPGIQSRKSFSSVSSNK